MPKPFEATPAELEAHLDEFVDLVFADLTSSFLVLPKGPSFVTYERFQAAYENLKRATSAFRDFTEEAVWRAVRDDGLCFVVLRTILGMSAPEWAELSHEETGVGVPQSFARERDAQVRQGDRLIGRRTRADTVTRLRAMIATACRLISEPERAASADTIHRLEKIDTAEGLVSLRHVAELHVPYAALLYERYLGRPFASHRDAISELIGDVMENAIDLRLREAHITARKTARAERVPGFPQAPDFIVPDELAPRVVIEAKMAADDGTARDKVTRILRLCELSRQRIAQGDRGFQTVACVDGRGFGVRRADMRQLLLATGGKVFTIATLDRLIDHTDLAQYAAT